METIVPIELKERMRILRQHHRATRRSEAALAAIWVAGLGALLVLVTAGFLEPR